MTNYVKFNQSTVGLTQPMVFRLMFLLTLGSVWLMCIGGCGSDDSEKTASDHQITPTIVCTIYPLYDLARTIAGDDAEVTLLLPAGRTPHGYTLTAADVVAIRNASLVIAAGGGVDTWIQPELIRRTKNQQDSLNLYHMVSEGEEEGADSHEGHDHDHGHAASAINPHQWLVPHRAIEYVESLQLWLEGNVPPTLQQQIRDRAKALKTDIEQIDREYRGALSDLDDRRLITFHDAFDPLAAEYDLDIVVHIFSTEQQQLTAEVLASCWQAEEDGVHAMFIEPQMDAGMASRIAKSATLRLLDPLGGRSDKPGFVTYPDLMRSNLQSLLEGLRDNSGNK